MFLNFQSIFFCIACILYVCISSKFENFKTGVPNKVGFVERTTALDSILAVDNSEGRPFQKKKIGRKAVLWPHWCAFVTGDESVEHVLLDCEVDMNYLFYFSVLCKSRFCRPK